MSAELKKVSIGKLPVKSEFTTINGHIVYIITSHVGQIVYFTPVSDSKNRQHVHNSLMVIPQDQKRNYDSVIPARLTKRRARVKKYISQSKLTGNGF